MATIYGKEGHDAFSRRMEEKNPTTPKKVPNPTPVARSHNSNVTKKPQAQNKAKGKAPATKSYSKGYIIPNIQQDAMENVLQMARNMMEIVSLEVYFTYQNRPQLS
ncbi:hypothetical protein O181_105681 [Austropuccinia psidii MF-1]|uniref:Uncharacterized protein n=1 Tax=Austropuccinia psidii MF-1 TaxID=1389203 RepID=A0A9Q3JPI8_9BASI|nr:hypothetical protein [Austropuccinia psidii MF-1]